MPVYIGTVHIRAHRLFPPTQLHCDRAEKQVMGVTHHVAASLPTQTAV